MVIRASIAEPQTGRAIEAFLVAIGTFQVAIGAFPVAMRAFLVEMGTFSGSAFRQRLGSSGRRQGEVGERVA